MNPFMKAICWLGEITGFGKWIDQTVSDVARRSVLALRAVFITVFFLLLGIIVIIGGLILTPLSLALYAPWDPTTKMTVLLCIGLGYLLVGIGLAWRMLDKAWWEKTYQIS